MEEGKILLVGNEADILHCGFSFPLSEGGKRYPSAYHYAHSMILTQLGLDEVHILELLATSSANVAGKARELLQENMPAGHDMNSLAHYLTTSRQSYTMAGLRLRAEQDKKFRQTLMDTNEALLIVCDRRDSELGIGMDDDEFVKYTRRFRADAEKISQWMRDERVRPPEIGQNQLGFFLMWLRYEIKEKERVQWMTTNDVKAKGISTDQNDQPFDISVSDFVVALQGIFQPLSNYYAMNFEIKGETYRSVEHYAYQRLFESMKLSDLEVMKIRTTVKPVDVGRMAQRLFQTLKIEQVDLDPKIEKLDRWRQSAMKHKISKNELLQQLLLSTGHAILIETTNGVDTKWSAGTDEFELQHLLTKKFVTPDVLIDWFVGRKKRPATLCHLGGNKTGLLLMELRTKFAEACTHRIPLISPLETNILRTSVSNHMICLTPESVLHPFYPSEIKLENKTYPSAIHHAAEGALKFFNACKDDCEWVMEPTLGPDCWSRLHHVITELMMPPIDKIQKWYMTERQNVLKTAMRLQFEQNPSLLRVLLDTGDALLVVCSRFASTEAELTIGMRERDLRLWLAKVRADSKSMIDLCLRPMAFRPPYFGGNRLGIILMEIRRDFILQGVFPHRLPDIGISVDAILGSESPMENYVPNYPFDILSDENYSAVWANAFLLMAKNEGMEPRFWNMALSKKVPPVLLSVDEAAIDRVMCDFRKQLESNAKKQAKGANMNGGNVQIKEKCFKKSIQENGVSGNDVELSNTTEVMRAVFAKLAASFGEKMAEDENIQREISKRSKENSRMQEVRRSAEKARDQALGINHAKSSAKTPDNKGLLVSQSSWTTPSSSNAPVNVPSGGIARCSQRSTSPRNRNGSSHGQNEAARGRPHNQLDPFSLSSLASGDKIPSLLSDFSAAAVAATAAAGGGGMTPAAAALLEKNFEKELQKILPKLASSAAANSGNNSNDIANRKTLLPHYRNYDNRGGGGGRPYGGGNPGGGRRGGGNIGRPMSPMTAYFQHQNRSRDFQHQQQPMPYSRPTMPPQQHRTSVQGTPTSSTTSGGTGQGSGASLEKAPEPKKPKRVVDESELSEGEILSDDDE